MNGIKGQIGARFPLGKALRILEAVAKESSVGSLADLSATSQLAKPTVHRLAVELERLALISRDPFTRRFHVGPRLEELAVSAIRKGMTQSGRRLHMERLAEKIGERVNIGVISANKVVYVHWVESGRPVPHQHRAGHAGARAMAAPTASCSWPTGRRRYAERILASAPFQAYTAHTITAAESLRRELQRIRRAGYSEDNEEFLGGRVLHRGAREESEERGGGRTGGHGAVGAAAAGEGPREHPPDPGGPARRRSPPSSAGAHRAAEGAAPRVDKIGDKGTDMNRRSFLVGIGVAGSLARGRSASAQAKLVRLGDIVAADLVYVASALAAEKGFFAEEGLWIKRSVYPNGPAVSQHMASGELDAGMAATFVLLTAKAQGVDLKLVMSLTKDNAPLAVRKDITTFKDLNGKRIGTPGRRHRARHQPELRREDQRRHGEARLREDH